MRDLCKCFILSLIILGCDSEEEVSRIGNVIVVVESASGSAVGGEVGTIPETKRIKIDEKGKAIFMGIPQGVYEFYASHPDLGSGSKTRTIFEDKTVEIKIELKNHNTFEPEIALLVPENNASFIFGKPVVFKANLFDDRDSPSNLNVKISSDIDGILFDGVGPANGPFEYSNSSLKKGTHKISFSVMDTDGFETSIDFRIKITIDHTILKIDSIASNLDGVFLSWTKELSPELQYYEILRGYAFDSFTKIAQFAGNETISYFDNLVDPNRNVFYKVKYILESDTFMSNVRSVFHQGRSVSMGQLGITGMISDSDRKYIYATNRAQNNLYFINVEDLKVENSILLVRPSYLTINRANDRLYVVTTINEYYGKIDVIDLNTQEVINEIDLTSLGGFHKPEYIEWVEGNKLVMLSGTWSNIHMLDLATEEIVYKSEQFLYPMMVANKSKNKLFFVHSTSDLKVVVTQYAVVSDSLIVEEQFVDSDLKSSKPVLSGNDKILYIDHKKYKVENLNNSSIATNGETVLASNYSGSRIAYKGGIYDTEQSELVRQFNFNSEAIIPYNNFKEIVAFNFFEHLMVFYKLDE